MQKHANANLCELVAPRDALLCSVFSSVATAAPPVSSTSVRPPHAQQQSHMRCFDLSLTFSVRVHCRTLIGRACHSNTNQINGQLGCAGHGISCASSIASSAPPRVCDSGCVALAGFGVQAQISRGGTTQGLSSEVIFVGCFCGPQCALWAAASVAARC